MSESKGSGNSSSESSSFPSILLKNDSDDTIATETSPQTQPHQRVDGQLGHQDLFGVAFAGASAGVNAGSGPAHQNSTRLTHQQQQQQQQQQHHHHHRSARTTSGSNINSTPSPAEVAPVPTNQEEASILLQRQHQAALQEQNSLMLNIFATSPATTQQGGPPIMSGAATSTGRGQQRQQQQQQQQQTKKTQQQQQQQQLDQTQQSQLQGRMDQDIIHSSSPILPPSAGSALYDAQRLQQLIQQQQFSRLQFQLSTQQNQQRQQQQSQMQHHHHQQNVQNNAVGAGVQQHHQHQPFTISQGLSAAFPSVASGATAAAVMVAQQQQQQQQQQHNQLQQQLMLQQLLATANSVATTNNNTAAAGLGQTGTLPMIQPFIQNQPYVGYPNYQGGRTSVAVDDQEHNTASLKSSGGPSLFRRQDLGRSSGDQINAFAVAKTTANTKEGVKKERKKPKRPLSAYNIFFKEERARILRSIPDKRKLQKINETDEDIFYRGDRQGQAGGNTMGDDNILDPTALGTTKESRRTRKKSPHGKMSFENLAREIGQRWKDLSLPKLAYYKRLADADMKRYKDEMEEFNSYQRIENDQKMKSMYELRHFLRSPVVGEQEAEMNRNQGGHPRGQQEEEDNDDRASGNKGVPS